MADVRVIIMMGVAGSGKTTVGRLLAAQLGWAYRDGDEFHLPASVAKMSAGIPLTDADREPWLAAIRRDIEARLRRGEPAIISCSALKAKYRSAIQVDPARVKFVFLEGDYALILERLRGRTGHFFAAKEDLVHSQFEALERPKEALAIDAAQTPAAIVARIRKEFGL